MQEVPALRPLSVGDIIDRTIRLFRANFLLLFAVAALPTLIVEVLQRTFGLSQTFDLSDFTSALNAPGGTVALPRQLQPVDPIAASVVGLVGFFILFPYVLLSLAVLGPAVVLEGLGPIASIRRSFHLMQRARWRTLGLYILMGIISSLLGLIFTLLFFVSFVSEPTVRTV